MDDVPITVTSEGYPAPPNSNAKNLYIIFPYVYAWKKLTQKRVKNEIKKATEVLFGSNPVIL